MTRKPHYRRFADGSTALVYTSDGYANVVASLGEANTKVQGASYSPIGSAVSPAMADAMYVSSTWYRKILEIPPDDATREWRSWKGKREQIKELEKAEKTLLLAQKIREALTVARHRGGAVIVMGGLPGAPTSELNLERVTKDSLKFLHVVSRDEITPVDMDRDPRSKTFGQPKMWRLNNSGGTPYELHPSRVAFFNGARVPGARTISADVWGLPIIDHLYDSIRASDSSAAIVEALMHESVVDVVQVPNFITGLASSDAEQLHMKRWQMAKQLKSVGSILLLDGDDKYTQKQITWNGLPDVVKTLLTVMSGAADIPVTRLLQTAATGQNATGEGDLINHYNKIRAHQTLDVSPVLSVIDEVLIRSVFGSRPDEIWYEWNPLWQPSGRELAEIDRLEANSATIYSKGGLVPQKAMEKAVQNRMIESGRWPGLEEALKEFPDVEEHQLPGLATLKAAEAKADPNARQAGGNASGVENQRENRTNQGRVNTVDMAPAPLYVRRDVVNKDEIVAWAKSQGFKTVLDDLHVTIVYSKEPVDWMKVGEAYEEEVKIGRGGPRAVEQFGEARVLQFASSSLQWRHESAKYAGASWDHSEYLPHITISYDPESPDLSGVEPYRGQIVLGPEIFEPIKDNWKAGVTES